MNRDFSLLAAGMVALAPALALAAPPPSGSISPNHETGQQVGGEDGIECEDFGEDAQPGHSATAPGSAFNEDGTSHEHYAGEQAGTNDKNTASVSQYDIACSKGPQ